MKAFVKGLFDPFTLTDLYVLKEYLYQGYESIGVVLLEGERYKEREEIARLIIDTPQIVLQKSGQGEEIRNERLSCGITRKDFLQLNPAAVSYCLKHMLYVEELAKRTLSDYRFHHVKCVAELASDLAEHYGLPRYMGYAAGYLHDITKEWEKEYHREYIRRYAFSHLQENPKKYHQYSAAVFLRDALHVSEEDIIDAVGNHVNGTSDRLLARIIFCSDKIDDSRGFDNTSIKALCFENLDQAYEQIHQRQLEHLHKKGIWNE